MPTLTVRALGEMLSLPMYQQLRILTDQKYPRQEPAAFRVPYYAPVLGGIRRFYASGNDRRVLTDTNQRIQRADYIESRTANNLAVLRAFSQGQQLRRALIPASKQSLTADLAGLELRFTPDLIADSDGTMKYILYNCRAATPVAATARVILDLANYVLSENGIDAEPRNVELVSLRDNTVRRNTSMSMVSIRRARQNARAIIQLWPTL